MTTQFFQFAVVFSLLSHFIQASPSNSIAKGSRHLFNSRVHVDSPVAVVYPFIGDGGLCKQFSCAGIGGQATLVKLSTQIKALWQDSAMN